MLFVEFLVRGYDKFICDGYMEGRYGIATLSCASTLCLVNHQVRLLEAKPLLQYHLKIILNIVRTIAEPITHGHLKRAFSN